MKNIESVDLNLLKAFDAVMEERHVTRAAERIGLSQPAMSNALNRLRHLFNDELLVRHSGGMEPTPRARELHEPIKRALASISAAINRTAEFDPRKSTRTFTLSMTDYTAFVYLPGLMKRLSEEAPGVNISVASRSGAAVAEQLQAGIIDLAIGLYATVPAGHKTQVIGQLHPVCMVRAGHPRVHGKIDMETFLELSHVVFSTSGDPTRTFEDGLSRHRLRRRIGLTVPHFLVVPFIVAQSDMIGVLDASMAQAFAKPLNLQIFDVPLPAGDFDVIQMWHRLNDNDPAQKWLREMIASITPQDAN